MDNSPRIPTSVRLAHEEPVAFEHEHARAIDALRSAEARLELAGHAVDAALVRDIRHSVFGEIARENCEARR